VLYLNLLKLKFFVEKKNKKLKKEENIKMKGKLNIEKSIKGKEEKQKENLKVIIK
jgi:hypothetical protein